MNNMCTLDKDILYICKYEFPYFLSKPNVFGVGLSYKCQNGFLTNQKCILVLVTKKVPSNCLPSNCCIPPCYKGIPTDIVSCGTFSLSSLTTRVRPAPGGYSIGPSASSSAGTLGCLVKDSKNLYILSASHVLTDGGIYTEDTPIIQPAVADGGRFLADRIALLKKSIPIYPSTSTHGPLNYVDCAMASVLSKSAVSPNIALVGAIHGLGTPAIGQKVKKVGKTSELTTGILTALGLTTTLSVSGKEYLFVNQIMTTRMSSNGDSGSILLDEHSNALGLLIGGSNVMTVCSPLSEVLSKLNVSLVTS